MFPKTRIEWLLAAFGLSLAMMFWPGQAGAAEPSRWAFLAVSVPLGLFAIKIRPTLVTWLIAALLGWAALTSLWSDVWYDAVNWWFELALLCGIVIIARETQDITWFYEGVAIGIALQLPICILQQLHYYPVIAVMAGGEALPSGLFVNPSMLGEACAPIAVVMLVKKRWLWLAIVVAVLLLSQNRSGILSFGLCLWLWAALRHRQMIWITPLLMAPVAYIALIKGVDPLSTIKQRWDIWLDVWSGLTLWGHGIGQFYVDFPLFNDRIAAEPSPTWVMTAHAHNDILEWAFELGLPGIAIIATLAFIVFRGASQPEAFGLLAICLTSMVGFPWHMPFTGAVGAVMAGYATRGWGMVRGDIVHRGPVLYRRRQYAHAFEPFESLPTIPV